MEYNKTVLTGRAIREFKQGVQQEVKTGADGQHSHEGQADSADRANWLCGMQFGQGGRRDGTNKAGRQAVQTGRMQSTADRQCIYRALKRAV